MTINIALPKPFLSKFHSRYFIFRFIMCVCVLVLNWQFANNFKFEIFLQNFSRRIDINVQHFWLVLLAKLFVLAIEARVSRWHPIFSENRFTGLKA